MSQFSWSCCRTVDISTTWNWKINLILSSAPVCCHVNTQCRVDYHGPSVNNVWIIVSCFWLALNPFCPLNAPLMYSAAVCPTPYSWILNNITMAKMFENIWFVSYWYQLGTLHMLKFVTSILKSWDSGKGNSLTACNTYIRQKGYYGLADMFSNPFKACFTLKSQTLYNFTVEGPVWESSPGRLGNRRALSQLAATWSNDPRKEIWQGAPKEGEAIFKSVILPFFGQSPTASPCLSRWSELCDTSDSSPGNTRFRFVSEVLRYWTHFQKFFFTSFTSVRFLNSLSDINSSTFLTLVILANKDGLDRKCSAILDTK